MLCVPVQGTTELCVGWGKVVGLQLNSYSQVKSKHGQGTRELCVCCQKHTNSGPGTPRLRVDIGPNYSVLGEIHGRFFFFLYTFSVSYFNVVC